MSAVNDVFDRIDRAERIRDVRDRYATNARAEQSLVLVEVQLSGIGNRSNAQMRALLVTIRDGCAGC
jgi:hypothetical protein